MVDTSKEAIEARFDKKDLRMWDQSNLYELVMRLVYERDLYKHEANFWYGYQKVDNPSLSERQIAVDECINACRQLLTQMQGSPSAFGVQDAIKAIEKVRDHVKVP